MLDISITMDTVVGVSFNKIGIANSESIKNTLSWGEENTLAKKSVPRPLYRSLVK